MTETTAKRSSKAARSGAAGPWGEVVQIKASGATFDQAAQIESTGPWTVATVEAVRHQGEEPDQQGVILPVDAAIGDMVELHVNGHTARVFTPEGDSFANRDENAFVDIGSSALFRKTEEKVWRSIAGA